MPRTVGTEAGANDPVPWEGPSTPPPPLPPPPPQATRGTTSSEAAARSALPNVEDRGMGTLREAGWGCLRGVEAGRCGKLPPETVHSPAARRARRSSRARGCRPSASLARKPPPQPHVAESEVEDDEDREKHEAQPEQGLHRRRRGGGGIHGPPSYSGRPRGANRFPCAGRLTRALHSVAVKRKPSSSRGSRGLSLRPAPRAGDAMPVVGVRASPSGPAAPSPPEPAA